MLVARAAQRVARTKTSYPLAAPRCRSASTRAWRCHEQGHDGRWLALSVAVVGLVGSTVVYNESASELSASAYKRDEPGVYLWGNNQGGVIDFESSAERFIKYPIRMRFFDNMILRTLAITSESAAAVDINGDVYQWGAAFRNSAVSKQPVKTIVGKNIIQVHLTSQYLVALCKSGKLYLTPIAQDAQQLQEKLMLNHNTNHSDNEKRGLLARLFGGNHAVSEAGYTLLRLPSNLNEKIVDCKVSDSHVLVRTDKGHLFSAPLVIRGIEARSLCQSDASSHVGPTLDSASSDQSTFTAFVELSPVVFDASTRNSSKPAEIAVGIEHSLVRTEDGRLYSWGTNTSGQLGLGDINPHAVVNNPVEIPSSYFLQGKKVSANSDFIVKHVTAAGNITAAVVERHIFDIEKQKKLVSELYMWGNGQYGTLGNGKNSNFQTTPTIIHALSGLSQYSDKQNGMIPISVRSISLSPTHAMAVLGTTLDETSSSTLSHCGNDVYVWGAGNCGQLGTGRRTQLSTPICPGPLPWKHATIPSFEKTQENHSDSEKNDDDYKNMNGDGVGRLQVLRTHSWVDKTKGNKKWTVQDEVVAGMDVSALYKRAVL